MFRSSVTVDLVASTHNGTELEKGWVLRHPLPFKSAAQFFVLPSLPTFSRV